MFVVSDRSERVFNQYFCRWESLMESQDHIYITSRLRAPAVTIHYGAL